ncbi:MAG: hypothetical protein JRJ85_12830 [Deltaproteobacteria bacterium]|nr:hypothetical protein [Deltaproteobacteria bacterium]
MKKLFVVMVILLGFNILTVLPSRAADTVINGCYKKKNGQLRIVNGPGECRPSAGHFVTRSVCERCDRDG